MRTIPAEADAVYRCCGAASVARLPVSHRDFRSYCLALRNFDRVLGEAASDEYWRPLLGMLKGYRFMMSAAPLQFSCALPEQASRADLATSTVGICESIYPQFAERADCLYRAYEKLTSCHDNPILDATSGIEDALLQGSVAVVLKESRLIPHARGAIQGNARLRHAEVLTVDALRSDACYQTLIVVGPVRWFPDFLFLSPRAHNTVVMCYDWIGDSDQVGPALIGCSEPSVTFPLVVPVDDLGRGLPDELLSADELVPRLDLSAITDPGGQSASGEPSAFEVDARVYLLEGGAIACLDASRDTRHLVIDLHAEDEEYPADRPAKVTRVRTSDIEPGMFLVLRTRGGGDYIVPVADRILGQSALRCRMMQREWKVRLANAVADSDLGRVCADLQTLGGARANEANVRYWLSERSIRPRDRGDFAAILRLTGLHDELSEYLEITAAIEAAHRRAGFHIRRLLLREVMRSDLRKLAKMGRMDFELAEAHGGSLSAIRVRDTIGETTKVPTNRLGHLLEGSYDLWQG